MAGSPSSPDAGTARADLLVINASEVLTMGTAPGPRTGDDQQDLGIVRDAGVVVRDGRIVDVAPMDALRHVEAAHVLDAAGRVVMPGFVDAHTHLVFAGTREREVELKVAGYSYQDIAKEGGGILSTVEATRKAPHAELLAQAKARLDRMLLHGTTTCEAKSGYALDVEGELRMLEVLRDLAAQHPVSIVPTFLGAHAIPPGRSADEFLTDLIEHALPVVAERGLARFCDVFVDQGYFDAAQGRRILKAAAKLGLRAKVHADELTRSGGAELAVEMAAASADHLLKADERAVRALAREKVPAVLLPCTPFASFMDGYADARTFIDKGVPVALGSDLSPNAWTESMAFVVQLAVYEMEMLPSEALVAATLNAAHAIGMEQEVGSLAPGKRADLMVLDVPTWHQVAYRLGHNPVDTVVKDGHVVVAGRARQTGSAAPV